MSDTPSRPTPDATSITRAIREGWFARGFLFGLGLWAAGLVVLLLPFVLVGLLGGSGPDTVRMPPGW